MSFLRNTFAVLLGLGVAMLIITIGLRINSEWITYSGFTPFEKWSRLLEDMRGNNSFFVALLISTGIASTIGGITTAFIVKKAKVAYAILIGFILLFLAVLDIVFFGYHPTFYQIGIFLTIFPFSWVGGKIIEVIFNQREEKNRKIQSKKHQE